MKVTGTFLDEISHDIPSQNWGLKDWDRDFACMKAVGIDTVILIRCGHKKWMTYPSGVMKGHQPPVDLVEMYLGLSENYGMGFYFGTYDSGEYWHRGDFEREAAISREQCIERARRFSSGRSSPEPFSDPSSSSGPAAAAPAPSRDSAPSTPPFRLRRR